MKNVILITSLFISISSYSQIVFFTYSPQQNETGLLFISKSKSDVALLCSFEYGYYSYLNTELNKLGAGTSILIDDPIRFNISILYSNIKIYKQHPIFKDIFSPISCELGFTTTLEELKPLQISVFIDPVIGHFKFGLGYNFSKN